MAGTFPEDLRYTDSDEWVRSDGDTFVAGVTSFAAEQLGDVVYLQLPDAGAHFNAGDSFGEIESVKAVSDLFAPLAGEIVESNADLDANPALVNEDPYGAGWIIRFRPDDPSQYDTLLDAAAYEQHTEEAH